MRKLTIFFAFLLFTGIAGQAQMQISGTVTDAKDGLSIPGVSIVVKDNPIIGTTTDINGNYALSVPANSQTLVFTFIGMKTQEIIINNRSKIDVVMESDVLEMDEVVVTAIGIKREKRQITYQTQKVDESEMSKMAPTRAASALAGKVAGLQINVQDNGVNPSSQILLRGLRSITGDNSALIVIDGSVSTQDAFDDLNPNDIANISILKGSTAAALYGSLAGNGALLVTTKTGTTGQKFAVGINSSYTLEKVAYMPDFQSEFGTGLEGMYDPIENTNWGPRYDGQLRQIGPTFPEGYGLETQMVPYAPVENNLLDFFENGNTWNNTIYMSGSSETSKFYVSFGDQRADGIVPDDVYQRNTLRVNASKKLGNIELSATANYFTDKTDVVGSTIGDQDRPLYWFILNTATNIPLSSYKDWQNPLSYGYADNYYNGYYQNPYWAIGTNRDIDETSRFIGNFNLSYNVFEWLNFTARISANNVWGNGKNWRAAQTYDPVLQPSAGAVSSFVEDSEFQDKNYYGDAMLTGDFKFMENFTLKTILGANINSRNHRYSMYRANNLSIPDFYDLSNGTGGLEKTIDEEAERNYGFFGDITLGYNNYVFLNFSGRNDWTSTLSAENNSYFYPSIGLSFVFTDAFSILKNKKFLTFGKVTLSNSTVYNDLDPYRINEIYSLADGFPYGEVNGFYLSNTAVDANITKEKINTTEAGLNLGFLSGRMWLDASYFKTITTDLITATTPSVASGSTIFLTNIGELEGTGLELTFGGTLAKFKDFKWDINLNYTNYETVVNEIYEGLDEIAITTTGQYGVYAVVGEAFPQIKANVYQRDPEGRIIVDPNSGHPLTEDGLANLGKTTPDYIVGLNTIASYKGFSVSATLDYRTGHVYYEQGSDEMEFTGRSQASVSANRQDFIIPNSVINTGTEENPVYVENTNIQVQDGRQGYWIDVYNVVKSNYVKDATALKLRELSISYELPANLLKKTPFTKVSIGFIGRNLMTWLPEENRFSDPEFNNQNIGTNPDAYGATTNITPNAMGIGGYLQSPPTKSYGFNLNIEF